jgi:diguanylate cyclase (GGDEF)-like protein
VPVRRAVAATVLAAAVTGIVYAHWPRMLGMEPSARVQDIVAVGIESSVAMAASAALWWRARRMQGDERLAWLLIAAAFGLWGLGSVTWGLYLVAGVEPETPSLVDVFYLGSVVPLALGVAVYPTGRRAERTLRTAVDGLLVAFSLLLVSWVMVLRVAFEDGVDTGRAEAVVNLAYPIADTLLVVMVIGLALRVSSDRRGSLALLSLGLAVIALTDMAWFVVSATGDWDDAPRWMDSGWTVGLVFVAGAASVLGRSGRSPARVRPGNRLEAAIALVPTSLGGLALLVAALDVSLRLSDLSQTLPLAISVAALLLLRQALSVAYGHQLAEQLEDSVQRTSWQAGHDRLTSLPNRSGLTDRLEQRRCEEHGPLGVLFADVDHLKAVNDSLGHAEGDRLIAAAAGHLAGLLGHDSVTRFGGDEFVAVVSAPSPDAMVEKVAGLVAPPRRAGRGPDGQAAVQPTLSVGLALWDEGLPGEEVLRRADTALFRAKARGRQRVVLYEPSMDEATRRRMELMPELQRALDAGELGVRYQPLVDLSSRRIIGAEALVRWEHPEHGLIGPAGFLAEADAAGMMEAIGSAVLQRAAEDFALLNHRPGVAPLHVAVNLSASELASPDAARRVADATGRAGLDPTQLVIEITEDVVVDDGTRRTIDQLLSLGVSVAIDDFGTGNSSLRQLGSYPATFLKIDRDFIEGLGRDEEDTFVVRAIINLARNLGMTTVAEGVETEEQLAVLHQLGCDAAQGWLFAPALTAEELAQRTA